MIPGPAKRSTLSECSVPEHRGFWSSRTCNRIWPAWGPLCLSEPAIAHGRFPNAVWQRS